jgi:hypothetical protein
LLALIAAMTAWRLGVAAILPVTQDEAYYFDWARSLAWGYFDHPPGVALLGIGTWLAPGSALAARSGTLIASALTLLVLARFFRNCGLTAPRDLALALVLVFATIPGFAGGVITTPDTVLGLAWALALHESERALAGQRRRWLTAGAAVGLGLLGKYTMVLIGPVLLLAIVFSDPRALRTRWPYLGGLVALLVFAPNILWNQQNDWLTMRFQFGHGFSTDVGALPVGAPGAIEHVGPGRSESDWVASRGISVPSSRFGGSSRSRCSSRLGSTDGNAQSRTTRRPETSPPRQTSAVGCNPLPLGILRPGRDRQRGGAELARRLFDLGSALGGVAAAPSAPLGRRRGTGQSAAAESLCVPRGDRCAAARRQSESRPARDPWISRVGRDRRHLEEPVYADRYQTTAMLRFYAPSLDTTTQWPGLTRPSEYLRGRIAPRLDPESVDSPFWLVSGFGAPPAIAGFAAIHIAGSSIAPGSR